MIKKISVLIVLSISVSFAQEFQFHRQIDPFIVIDANGTNFEFPFYGGFNTPVIQFIDIDGDTDPDLFVQDRSNQLSYFQNTGSGFEWQTDYYKNLEIGSWFKFADIDNDNDYELFTEFRNTYIRYYFNIGTPTSANFIRAADTLFDNLNQPISLNGFSIPEWSDLDNDNQLELFFGLQDGHIAYYDFSGIDPNNVPIFTFISDTFQNLQIVTGGGKNNNQNKHGANALSLADIDNDNDFDLFWGDFFASSIVFIQNTGTPLNPNFEPDDIIDLFPGNNPIQTGGFNVPRFADIDADNDLDMFVGIIGGSGSTLRDREKNFYFYENTGNPGTYQYNLYSKNFIHGIDLGQNTIPAFVDIDNDNDLDLFIANQEDLDTPNIDNSRLYFYQNIGSSLSPSFQLADSNYLNYDKRFDTNYAPAFVDIDNDNDFDLFLGKWDGRLTFYQNDGSANTPNFTRISEFYQSIDVGNNSAPFFVDIDDDNDFDLFIGEFSGNINFYRNTGNASNPNFILDTTHYFGLDAGEYSYPFFVDIDNDQDYDLFFGSDTGNIAFFRNSGNAAIANFVHDNSFQLPLSLRSSPNFIDIDGDGDLDVFSGSAGGGIIFYSNLNINAITMPRENQIPQEFILFQNYPNPFNPGTTIQFKIHQPAFVELKIFNTLGQQIDLILSQRLDAGSYSINWTAPNLSSGIYFYQLLLNHKNHQIKKMTYLK